MAHVAPWVAVALAIAPWAIAQVPSGRLRGEVRFQYIDHTGFGYDMHGGDVSLEFALSPSGPAVLHAHGTIESHEANAPPGMDTRPLVRSQVDDRWTGTATIHGATVTATLTLRSATVTLACAPTTAATLPARTAWECTASSNYQLRWIAPYLTFPIVLSNTATVRNVMSGSTYDRNATRRIESASRAP